MESWSSRQYQGWATSPVMGFKLNELLVGKSHNLGAAFTPAHLVGWTKCSSKVLWLGCCPNHSTERLGWLQEMNSLSSVSSISSSHNQSHCLKFLWVSIALSFYIVPEMPTHFRGSMILFPPVTVATHLHPHTHTLSTWNDCFTSSSQEDLFRHTYTKEKNYYYEWFHAYQMSTFL